MAESLRGFVARTVDGSSHSLARKLLLAEVSSRCSLGLLKFTRAIRNLEPWAFRLIDASGKYPTGVFQATSTDLGAYDECIETVERDELGREKMRGQYCNLHIAVGKDLSLLTEMIPALRMSHESLPKFLEYVLDRRLPGIRLGICTMEDCNQTEIESLIKAVAGNSVEVTVKNCVTNRRTQIQKTQAFIL